MANCKRVSRISMIRAATFGGAVLAAASIAAPAAADVKTGVDAWSDGDYARAISEWQGPAAAGDADALFNLAQAYRLGRGVEIDMARASELYAKAAEKGHLKAAENYGLLLFQQGQQSRAMPLIRAAADRGDPRAQYVLGLAHFNADYAEKDWVRAYALLTLAQSSGLPQAANALQQMDEYVPENQRQMAQSLARELEAEATRRRAADLAALDLGAAKPAKAVPPAPAAKPVRVAARQTREDKPRAGAWRVQLGAFGVASNAERLWSRLSDNPALSGASKLLVPAGKVTRLHAAGFVSQGEAQSACSQLKREGHGCYVTKS